MTVSPDPPPEPRWMQPDADSELLRLAKQLVAESAPMQEFGSFLDTLEAWERTPRAWVVTKAINYLLDASLGGGLTPRLVDLRRRLEKPPDSFLLDTLSDAARPERQSATIEDVGEALAILSATGPGLSVGDVLVTPESEQGYLDVVAVDGLSAWGLLRSPREKYKVGEPLINSQERSAWLPEEAMPLPFEVRFMTNDSPVAGRTGFVVARNVLVDRITREAGTEHCNRPEHFPRDGPLPFSIRDEEYLERMVADMRNAGMEFMVSGLTPTIKSTGLIQGSPRERCAVLANDRATGDAIFEFSVRGAELLEMRPSFKRDETIMVFEAFSQDLVGVSLDLKERARRSRIIGRSAPRYASREGRVEWRGRRGGALVSKRGSVLSDIAHRKLSVRHSLFVAAGETVHAGMVIGECPDQEDTSVDVTAQSFRFMDASEVGSVRPARTRQLSLAEALVWLGEEEVLEVTPGKLRIWKPGFDVGTGTETQRVRA